MSKKMAICMCLDPPRVSHPNGDHHILVLGIHHTFSYDLGDCSSCTTCDSPNSSWGIQKVGYGGPKSHKVRNRTSEQHC